MDSRDSQSKWDPESSSFWEEDPEQDDMPRHRAAWPIKVGAGLVLIVFIAFAYAWLPNLCPPHLDFLQQNKELSQDALVKNSRPAVVRVQVTKEGSSPGSFSHGTGFNISPQGVVITNRHVAEEAQFVKVLFSDQQSFLSQAIEFPEGLDLAIIYLKQDNLPYLPVATDELAEPGQIVTIIGNPQGVSRVAVRGIVKDYYRGTDSAPLVFSIDAPIEPGSSGSPVLDEEGRVVGIIFAMQTLNVGDSKVKYALAIPASYLP